MKHFNLAFICLLYCSYVAKTQSNIEKISSQAFSIGERIEIKSNELGENRVLNIYLPQGYAKDSLKQYPVIYLLDGSADEDFIHIAGLIQFGTFPWLNMLPESILVGIANVDRKRDFTFPTNNEQDKKDFPTTGGSEHFIQFIKKELQSFIAINYRTTTAKTLIGQSLGGLLATEVLFKEPQLFDNYIIVSPSLWWDDESLLQYNPKISKTDKKIYIAVGKEGPLMERIAKELRDKLQKENIKNREIHFEFFGDQDHANILHLAVYRAFEKLLKPSPKEEDKK